MTDTLDRYTISITKEELSEMPRVEYNGVVRVVDTAAEMKKAVSILKKYDILGFDTESKPTFKKGATIHVSLIQIAAEDICFLFRLNYIGMVTPVISLLSNTDVPMVGLSWHDDLAALQKRMEFKPGLFIDIQDIIGDIGIEDKSLQKLYANIFKQKISKRQRLTNWDADVLSDKQMSYAATDAWACVRLYKEILKLKETGDYSLIIKDDINNSIANV